MERGSRRSGRGVSRRHFLRKAASGAGVAVAISTTTAEGDQRPNDLAAPVTAPATSHPLRIPAEFSSAAHTAPTQLQFPMTGAQVVAQACRDEGVAALFCCPGHYGVVHALAGIGIPTFSGRREGSMTHAADAYAFRQLRSGVPRPVHLDFPVEVAAARFTDASELSFFHDKTKYRTDSRPHLSSKEIDAAVALLPRAERPMIVSSNGVFYRRPWEPLRRLAEKAAIPVVASGAMKGQFPDDHALSANTAPGALGSADVVLHSANGAAALRRPWSVSRVQREEAAGRDDGVPVYVVDA